MAYHDTIEYLYGLQKHGIKLGLSNCEALLEALDAPQRQFRSIHIAGTNGKGSTAAFLASILGAAGLRTGLYTSPHLVSFTERIRVDGAPVSEETGVDLAERTRSDWRRTIPGRDGTANPTFFEVTTAMAFAHFAERVVDMAVVEAGMGGRLDATNVIMPLASVITTVDFDHMEFLGATLREIAGEKAGIIKPGVPVVLGACRPEAAAVIERAAMERNAPAYRLGKDFSASRLSPGRTTTFLDYTLVDPNGSVKYLKVIDQDSVALTHEGFNIFDVYPEAVVVSMASYWSDPALKEILFSDDADPALIDQIRDSFFQVHRIGQIIQDHPQICSCSLQEWLATEYRMSRDRLVERYIAFVISWPFVSPRFLV